MAKWVRRIARRDNRPRTCPEKSRNEYWSNTAAKYWGEYCCAGTACDREYGTKTDAARADGILPRNLPPERVAENTVAGYGTEIAARGIVAHGICGGDVLPRTQ